MKTLLKKFEDKVWRTEEEFLMLLHWSFHTQFLDRALHFFPHILLTPFAYFHTQNKVFRAEECYLERTICSVKKITQGSRLHPKAADQKPNMILDQSASRSAFALTKAMRICALHSYMVILRPEMICINTSGPLHPKLSRTIEVQKQAPAQRWPCSWQE